MSNSDDLKTGDFVDQTGVYVSEWGHVEMLKAGKRLPDDPVMGKAKWKMAHFPFDNQQTSINVPPEYRNEIQNRTEKDRKK